MIVGIDVSKDKLDVCVLPKKTPYVIKNSTAGIRSFFKNKLNKIDIEWVVFEATGGYERKLHLFLLEEGLPHHRVHPQRVYHFAQSRGLYAKTDGLDAATLACYGQQKENRMNRQIQNKNQLRIREYSSRRNQLKEMQANERRRLSVVQLEPEITRSMKRNIKQLERELQLITQKLNELINGDQALKAKRELLQTAKGVGSEVATMLVCDLPELGQLSREEISHLVGVAPQTRESGKKSGYRAISRGRFYVRRILYMAALVAIRYNTRMKRIYEGLVARGKLKKVALVAVMRKMIIMLNAMIKNKTPWQQERI